MDEPSGSDLLVEVARALRLGLASDLERRLAANAIDLALRERTLAGRFARRSARRVRALLDRKGSAAELAVALCDAIRTGWIPADDPDLLAHLRESAREKMAIDNPAYPAMALHEGR